MRTRANLYSPSAERNKQAICTALATVLPDTGLVLEIGSGTGQHAEYFLENFSGLKWLPSELPEHLSGLRQCQAQIRNPALLPGIELDVREPAWHAPRVNVVYTANTLHIMSWQSVCALFTGTARHLQPAGCLVIYGPFDYHGQHTTPSNAGFHENLRAQSAAMGLRDVDHRL